MSRAPHAPSPDSRGVLPDSFALGCVDHAPLFQNPLVEDPPAASAPAEVRHRYASMVRQAQVICEACPLVSRCLYQSVVEYDIAGYTGATTARQRSAIRRRLQISVEPEDLDTLAGVSSRHHQIDHREVVRLRQANPHESLEALARRLGCSLSTVKRHLRRERSSPTTGTPSTAPTLDQVLRAAAAVAGSPPARQAVAA